MFESNTPARAVYRKAGFREVGGPPETVGIEDRAERVIRMVRPHVVAIHQPNFFPWLGFFDKLERRRGPSRNGAHAPDDPDEPGAVGRAAAAVTDAMRDAGVS